MQATPNKGDNIAKCRISRVLFILNWFKILMIQRLISNITYNNRALHTCVHFGIFESHVEYLYSFRHPSASASVYHCFSFSSKRSVYSRSMARFFPNWNQHLLNSMLLSWCVIVHPWWFEQGRRLWISQRKKSKRKILLTFFSHQLWGKKNYLWQTMFYLPWIHPRKREICCDHQTLTVISLSMILVSLYCKFKNPERINFSFVYFKTNSNLF